MAREVQVLRERREQIGTELKGLQSQIDHYFSIIPGQHGVLRPFIELESCIGQRDSLLTEVRKIEDELINIVLAQAVESRSCPY